jgi:hypothetical protein
VQEVISVVDREARNKLAEAMRALANGLITNDEFEDKRLPRCKDDPAISEIFSKGAWLLYSDLEEYRLTGIHQLNENTKSVVARWVLFLKTDLPYEWPVSNIQQGLLRFVANILTLGAANKTYVRKYHASGDINVWPFLRRIDYELAIQNPVYLNNAL